MRRIPLVAVLPVLIVLAAVVYAVVLIAGDTSGDDIESRQPVDLVASGPEFASLDELAAASDRVVHGEVVAVEFGRAITDPTDPTAGVRTQLASVVVDQVRKGPDVATIIVEQEATLLDGTPVTVNGVAPLTIGDRGWLYLIDGDSEQFPYSALAAVDGFVSD